MNTAENKNKSEMEMIKEGCLMASYGKTFFFTINSSLQIGKFKCSVVKIGTQGKDSLDIYLSVGEVKRLVDDILTGLAFKKIAAEKSNYPSTYKYSKGTNGCNILNIGKSTVGNYIGVQAGLAHYDGKGNKEKTDYHLTPVSADDFKDFAVRFYVCVCGLLPTATGFVPVLENTYYGQMNKVFLQGEEERKKFFKKTESQNRPEPQSEPASPQKPQDKPMNNNQQNNQPASNKKPSIKVRSTSTLNRNEDGSYCMQAVKESDNSIINIRIPADAVAGIGEKNFNAFIERVNTCGSEFGFTGKKIKENGEEIYVFAKFVK